MSMYRWILLLIFVVPLMVRPARAAVGDMSFRVASTDIAVPTGAAEGVPASIDVFVDREGGGSVPAVGWGIIFEITPAAGATGSVLFDPPPVLESAPNLAAASVNPFIDFDRDFGGMSYGELGDTALELHAVAAYVPPLTTAPPLDAHGNLALPDGAGLTSLPLLVSADAAGVFIVSVIADSQVSGVLARTGDPAPNDTTVHPAGAHVAGMITVEQLSALAGDYNRNGTVDAADYVVWRNTLGQAGLSLPADGNGDDTINQLDYDVWKMHFGQSAGSASSANSSSFQADSSLANSAVPEPTTLVLLMMVAAGPRPRRRWTALGTSTTRRSVRHANNNKPRI